ncbi:TM2 domain-containing protein CG10795 [Maniola jurtina]|uniref:TM2 domain-containing protein CG10795 n=1 Tax=Maniola jurtina TaxID=191418 RepID=UPI001E6864DE|nr:TM2 domain-containing protein CG10795 [Maniola jurtina]XP_045771338.1 TM2 domain-containing protein CG10795 [Maniola jurtina]
MSRLIFSLVCLLFLHRAVHASDEAKGDKNVVVDCSTLRLGQYICPDPNKNQIDPDTQQFVGCAKGKSVPSEGEADVLCLAADGIICNQTNNSTFWRKMPCKWTNGYSLEIALLLSVFLGMFGLDRFYLGYPGIGLAKLCTLGFMFLGQLLDIILIAAQVVGPSDGSAYIIPYYGAGVTVVRSDNETYLLPQADWHNIT